jgi:alternative ribosome-rescue factor|tara:strand:+ start:385 stop:507 length:123 start_codon:yes stop_codon:yes gene_type:complete
VKKSNLIAKNLKNPKFRPRVIKSKKGKGSFKRKKSKFNLA